MIMKIFQMYSKSLSFTCTIALLLTTGVRAADWSIQPELQEYFKEEVQSIEARSRELLNPENGASWEQQQPKLRRQLSEMLGLYPCQNEPR